jgi:hypothetical protein
LIISSRISFSSRFLLCGSIVSAKYRHLYFRMHAIWNNTDIWLYGTIPSLIISFLVDSIMERYIFKMHAIYSKYRHLYFKKHTIYSKYTLYIQNARYL